VDKAACFSRTPQFVKLCAVKPPFRICTPANPARRILLLRVATAVTHDTRTPQWKAA
jgi:hypothetical protein